MRLLFTDIDGVLHPAHAIDLNTGWFCWVDELSTLLHGHADVGVVVHSSWRYDHTDAEFKQLLGPAGRWFAGSAPRMRREQAIQSVLQANKFAVTSHLVLDDDPREFEGSTLNLVLCDSRLGLLEPLVQSLVASWLSSTAPA